MTFQFIDFALDPTVGCLHGPEGEIHLRPKTLALLEVLVAEAPAVVTKDELMDRVWGQEHLGETSLAQAVGELRRALCDDSRQPRIIETLHRRGYRFIAPLEVTAGDARSEGSQAPELSRREAFAQKAVMAVPELRSEADPGSAARARWTKQAFLASLVGLGILALVIGIPRALSQPVTPMEELESSRLERVTVFVISFQDQRDADQWLEVGLPRLLRTQVEEHPRIYLDVPLRAEATAEELLSGLRGAGGLLRGQM